MLISCGQCRTTFTLPDEFIALTGTAVQCTRCSHTFIAHWPVTQPIAEPPLFVTCEQCSTVFSLDAALVPAGGATVQCTRCNHSFWLPRDPPRRDVMIFGGEEPGATTGPPRMMMFGPKILPSDRMQVFGPNPLDERLKIPPPLDPLLEALYEQVWAAPDDDAPRVVLADHLTERGDPRGEFIAIQLAEPDGPTGLAKGRSKELKRHYGDWLPPGVERQSAVFHRGFLVACRWVAATEPGHREWKTVERLDLKGADLDPGALFAGNALRSLKELRGADARAFIALCSSPARTRVQVVHTFHASFHSLASHLGELASFTAMTSLDLEGTALTDDGFALLCRKARPELSRVRIDDDGRLSLMRAREALSATPGRSLTIHYDRPYPCWFEIVGGEVRVCHGKIVARPLLAKMVDRARREGLTAVLIPVED